MTVGYRRKNSHGEAVPIYRSLYGPLRCDKGFDSDLPDQLTRFFCPVCSSQRDGSEILSGRKGRAFLFEKIGAMLWECFPLFGSTFLIMYIGNAPKYAIDSVLSNQDQASFNYVFMPVFVISLLSNFIYQPVLNKLAVIWNQRETSRFWKLIAKLYRRDFRFNGGGRFRRLFPGNPGAEFDLRRTPGRLPASFGNPFGRRRLAGFNQFFLP